MSSNLQSKPTQILTNTSINTYSFLTSFDIVGALSIYNLVNSFFSYLYLYKSLNKLL